MLGMQHSYFFSTEMKLVSRVKIASSCIRYPNEQRITENPPPYLFSLNTVEASRKSGVGLLQGGAQNKDISDVAHTKSQHTPIAL